MGRFAHLCVTVQVERLRDFGDTPMLVTSTLLFFGFAVWNGVSLMVRAINFAIGPRPSAQFWNEQVRKRLRFLMAFAVALMAIYVVYLLSLRR